MRIIFKNFTTITHEEKLLILEWRNSERVRRQMIDKNIIELEDHLKWIDNLSERPDRLYFLVYDDNEPVGVLDFTSIDRESKKAEWGFYLKPGNRPGFGVIGFLGLKNYFETWCFNILNSRVLSDNKRSIHWHEKLFFQICRTKSGLIDLGLSRQRWLEKSPVLRSEIFKKYNPKSTEWIL